MSLRPVNAVLVVNRHAFTLSLLQRPMLRWKFRRMKTYPIAVGRIGYESPKGFFLINSRAKCPEWLVPDSSWARMAGLTPGTIVPGCTDANPIKARWLGVTDPAEGVGIHGTADDDSIGSAASHGCFRMHVPDVVELFDQVKLYTPVVIL